MGRKVWLWIILGLAVLLALAVTAAIWLGVLGNDGPEAPPAGTGTVQEETPGESQAPPEQTTAAPTAEAEQTTAATAEPTQTQTEQEQEDSTFPPPANENQLPLG